MGRYPKQQLTTYVQQFPHTFSAQSQRRAHQDYNFYSSAPQSQSFLTEVLSTHHPGPTILHIESGKGKKSWNISWLLLIFLFTLALLGFWGSYADLRPKTSQFTRFASSSKKVWGKTSTEDAIVEFILSVNEDEESFLEDLPYF